MTVPDAISKAWVSEMLKTIRGVTTTGVDSVNRSPACHMFEP